MYNIFHGTKETAKNRIMLSMQNEQLCCSSSTMQQVKKEIKEECINTIKMNLKNH